MFSDMYPFLLISQVSHHERGSCLGSCSAQNSYITFYRVPLMPWMSFSRSLYRSADSDPSMFVSNYCFVTTLDQLSCHSILVDGCEPFAEDLWTEILIDNFTFHGVKLCSRCKVYTAYFVIYFLCFCLKGKLLNCFGWSGTDDKSRHWNWRWRANWDSEEFQIRQSLTATEETTGKGTQKTLLGLSS